MSQSQVADKRPAYIGKRQVMRLCSDVYGKGFVRSNQESINLRVAGTDDDVTSAESFHIASFVQFPRRDLINWRGAIYQDRDYAEMLARVSVDWRNPERHTHQSFGISCISMGAVQKLAKPCGACRHTSL